MSQSVLWTLSKFGQVKTSSKSFWFPRVPDAACFEVADWLLGRSPGGSGRAVA